MPQDPLSALQELAQSLAIVNPGDASPGQLAKVTLSPAASELSIADSITRTLDLLGLTKNVRFEAPGLVPKPLSGNLKVVQQAVTGICGLPVIKQVCQAMRPPGIGGGLAQVQASWMVPTEVATPLKLTVDWKVTDANGNELKAPNPAQNEIGQLLAPAGLSLPELSVVLRPEVRELSTAPDLTPVIRKVSATVTLEALGVQFGPLDLPPVDVPVLPLLVPTVLVMFLDKNFATAGNSAALVVLPSNSPFGSVGDIVNKLNALRAPLDALKDFLDLGAFFTGIPNVVGWLNAVPHVWVATADVANLNDITLIHYDSWFENDIEAEDELSSLVLIGPAGRVARLFNARNFNSNEGQLDVTVPDSLMVQVADLHSATPSTTPSGLASQVQQPAGTRFDPPHSITTFGDEISSVELR
jgi:hypothetical protein